MSDNLVYVCKKDSLPVPAPIDPIDVASRVNISVAQQEAFQALSPELQEDVLDYMTYQVEHHIEEMGAVPLEGQYFGDQLEAIQSKQIPNITATQQTVRDLIGLGILINRNSDWAIPTREIVNATLFGGPYPTLVPFQKNPLPIPAVDVKCNPEILPCTTLNAWLTTLGRTMLDLYNSSYPGKIQTRFDEALDTIESTITLPITAPLIDILQMATTIKTAETILATLNPILFFDTEESAWQLVSTFSSTLTDIYFLFDRPDTQQSIDQILDDRIRGARLCRVFNGRLPNCTPLPNISFPELPPLPIEAVYDPSTGFLRFVFLFGFAASCALQGGCLAGSINVQPSNFDGLYVLSNVGSNGFPIYMAQRAFEEFGAVDSSAFTRLFLWQGITRVDLSTEVQFSWAAITPDFPETFRASRRGARRPFAFVQGIQPPLTCTSTPPERFVPIESPLFDTVFPVCMNSTNLWRFGRLTTSGCNGVVLDLACIFPALVFTLPTTSPAFWPTPSPAVLLSFNQTASTTPPPAPVRRLQHRHPIFSEPKYVYRLPGISWPLPWAPLR
eukprot:GHVT01099075.1.p1 GENE.GHVT01099075.1~~GHVT01099075.1.p1  ORF type:complete len:559 (+),score=17.98 GHVT01099075.1:1402-3078(+)